MIKNIPKLLKKIYEEIRNSCDISIIASSGGADSLLSIVLCIQALGIENVYAVGLPYSERDETYFNARSYKTAKKLGVNYTDIPIYNIFDNINWSVQTWKNENKIQGQLNQVNAGNSRARSRMCILYGIAHELGYNNPNKRVRVVDTCNLSESFVGYFTKNGDGAGDISIIGDLFKSEVYQLLDYFIQQGILSEEDVDRVPSAGFGWTDEEELGYDYNSMEKVIRWYLKLTTKHDENYYFNEEDNNDWNKFQRAIKVEGSIEKFVMDRYVQNAHKHQAPPVFELRKYIKE